MRYLKWQSEDGIHLIESMIGRLTSEFIALADSYIEPSEGANKIKMISDLRFANLDRISNEEAYRLGKACGEQFAADQEVLLIIVVEDHDLSKKEKISQYVLPLGSKENINVFVRASIAKAYDQLAIPAGVRCDFDRQIKEILESRD